MPSPDTLGVWSPFVTELAARGVGPQDIERAIDLHRHTGERLDRVFAKLGVDDETIARALAASLNYDFVQISLDTIDPQAVRLLPRDVSVRHRMIPLRIERDELVVAVADPLDTVALDNARIISGRPVRPVVATEDDIRRALGMAYPTDEVLKDVLRQVQVDIAPALETVEVSPEELERLGREAPAVQATNLLILRAVQENASDIHIEPQRDHSRVRYRIDGVLYDVTHLPRSLHPAVVARIKVMAMMDLAQTRLPQDGRIHVRIDSETLDLRVSTSPSTYGEKVVLRLLRLPGGKLTFTALGMHEHDRRRIEDLLALPHGLILACGPTGSGKTTTLYTALRMLNLPDRNIVTIEDPVEYRVDGITQIQVNPRIGLDFASALRSILRQDPDIIMVGEIRDEETARVAVHAALTGHLVLATLHTNDAPSALTRLLDMGVEPYLVASSVTGVVAQRLVRLLCPDCRAPYVPSPELAGRVGTFAEPVTWYRPVGCSRCHRTGYRGRTGVFEVLTVGPEVRRAVLRRAPTSEIAEIAVREGMRTLRDDCLSKVMAGLTSVEELLRVIEIER